MDVPKLLFFNDAALLEGPCWDAENRLLYFVSIKGETVFALDQSGRIKSYATDGPVGCAVLRGGKLITAEKHGIFSTDLKSGEKSFLCHAFDDEGLRYNDGKLDPRGRLFVGTIGDNGRRPGGCALYRINDGEYQAVVTGVTVSNGLGWSSDGKTMYFIDTPTGEVWKYDYDLDSGEMSGKTVAARIEDGSPDGMCVDIDDTCYVAHWGGGKVSHWDMRTGERIGEILLPVANVSSCTVGGENMDTLFITTAKDNGKDEPLAGGLFQIKIR